MRRRTFRAIRAAAASAHHHHVYVVLLSPEAAELPEIRMANPKCDPQKPCVYVGMSGLPPAERFENHKKGIKSSRAVHRFGIRLLPELYDMYNPMPYDAALAMERDLAEDLRSRGFTVAGGH